MGIYNNLNLCYGIKIDDNDTKQKEFIEKNKEVLNKMGSIYYLEKYTIREDFLYKDDETTIIKDDGYCIGGSYRYILSYAIKNAVNFSIPDTSKLQDIGDIELNWYMVNDSWSTLDSGWMTNKNPDSNISINLIKKDIELNSDTLGVIVKQIEKKKKISEAVEEYNKCAKIYSYDTYDELKERLAKPNKMANEILKIIDTD